MNDFQKTLYRNLMILCEVNEKKAFFFTDHVKEDVTYRIFNYRIASYTDFQAADALECRGIMFEIDENDEAVRLAALPMEKFFNVGENPSTIDLDFSNPKQVMLKEDGSLMSTFLNKRKELCVKSKGSLSSTQVIDTERYLSRNSLLHNLLHTIDYHLNATVNMEYCAPTNRIVIGYMEPKLTILNVRSRISGRYINKEEVHRFLTENSFEEQAALLNEVWVHSYPLGDGSHETIYENYVDLKDLEGIEGYVLQLASGQHVKTKCEWYLVQHRAKDSVNNPRRLFEVVLEEASDDLRTLFHDDPLAIQQISEMEELVESLYNPLVDKVESFYSENKSLERKDYAIKGQSEFTLKGEFGLAMNMYLGKPVDFKEHMKKNYKSYGIADIVAAEDEEFYDGYIGSGGEK
jgi:T4 RnlA family RNA ligase